MKARMLSRPKTGTANHKRQTASSTGKQYEDYALAYLQQRGLKLLQRNFRCRTGELDLIMLDRGTLVFIEVKYRRHSQHGTSIEQVTWHKRKKLINSAQLFLACHKTYVNKPCRFDVVGISADGDTLAVNWISNALEIA